MSTDFDQLRIVNPVVDFIDLAGLGGFVFDDGSRDRLGAGNGP